MKEAQTAEVIEIEKALLGGILLDSDILPTVIGKLDPDDFYLDTHRRVYRGIIQQKNDALPIDYLSVFERVGDMAFGEFFTLYDAALPGHAVYFAGKIKEAAVRRELQKMLQASLRELGTPGVDLESEVSYLSGDFVKLMAKNTGACGVGDEMVETLKTIENKGSRTIMKTGLRGLDGLVGGMFRGDYWVIAGRTSMGKSSCAETICLNVAAAGFPTVYVSIEGSNESLRQRLLAIQSGVWMSRIKSGYLRDIDFPKLSYAAGVIAKLPIYTYDAESKWEKIKAQIELLKFKDPSLAVVFLDYLGLMSAGGFKNRWDEIGFISSDFKRLCVRLNVCGVMVCQINRQTENRKDHKPTLADLRDSGAIEQDADLIALLYRPHYYDKSESRTLAEVGVAKNRDGSTGTVEMSFDAECVRFRDRMEDD